MGFACGKNKEAKTKPNKQQIQADLTLSLKAVASFGLLLHPWCLEQVWHIVVAQ